MRKILYAILVVSAIAYAGGAASLVGKKSVSKGYTYSYFVRSNFLDECKADANEDICRCVLDKIQYQYSENEFKKIDKDLKNGTQHPEFVNYVSKAAQECDNTGANAESDMSSIDSTLQMMNELVNKQLAEALGQGESDEGMTEADAMEYATNLVKQMPKKAFVPECAKETSKLLGDAAGKKTCGCAYDHMTKDIPRLTQYVLENGIAESDSWGAEYVVECVPDKYTPEIRKNFVTVLNQNGVPKSTAQCLLKVLEKEYTLRNFLTAAMKNKTEAIAALMLLGAKCFIP